MASASSIHEEEFVCSICLDVFTDPITTPCGHNYCKACITKYWNGTDVCQCPLCKEIFYKRPKLYVNKVVSVMADQFRKLKLTSSTDQDPEVSCEEPSKPEEVFCDICTETKAIKTCLVCRTSYCETHLEPHQRVTKLQQHKLIDPVKNLEDIMCKKHDRPLELFCKTDDICVCQFCTESDHKTHQVVSVKEEFERKKVELGKTEAEVQQMIQERQEKIKKVKHSAELSRKDADKEIADSVQVFTALISCIERSQAEVVKVTEEKQKTTEKQAEDLIKELQQEISELKKRSSELKQLSHTEDHLHLLQNFTSINTPPPTKDWTKVNVDQTSYVGTATTALAQLANTLSQEMAKLQQDMKRFQRYAVDVTLDPDKAHCDLILSEDGKQVRFGDKKKPNIDKLSDLPTVLGKESFSSGRFYYEVQVKEATEWILGVARESVFGQEMEANDGLWTIAMGEEKYIALADPAVILPVKEKLQKVGVFVDYEEGLVSFYDVETRVHLYSFTGCTFTDKLYPMFSPHDSAPLIVSPVNHTH